jgi:hypothetical protein
MTSIEFDPTNPSEYENFISEDDIKFENRILNILLVITMLAMGLGIYALYKQSKDLHRYPKRDVKFS